jgi:tRNA (cmo5U34)-methyltransferase
MSTKEFFSFDTVDNFDKHIAKQILEYNELDSLIKDISINFLADDTNVYDLGCSTGRLIRELAELYKDKKVIYYGLENNQNFSKEHISNENVRYLKQDLRENYNFNNASIILSIFTLQFIGENNRLNLLKNIYNGLNRGGAFILSEKIYSSTSRIHKILEMRNWDIKKKSYTDKEVLQDEKDLRDIMKPLTLEDNINDLYAVGFREVELIWRFNNFIGILCIK